MTVTEKEKVTQSAKDVSGTMERLNQSWYDTYRSVLQSTFDVQRHAVEYTQSVLTDGINTLKDNIEVTQRWVQTASKPLGMSQSREREQGQGQGQDQNQGQGQGQQEPVTSLVESGVEVYKRNVSFLQRTFEHGVETLKSNAETMRDMAETLQSKAQEQQNIAQGQREQQGQQEQHSMS